jgi:hypothetical protein
MKSLLAVALLVIVLAAAAGGCSSGCGDNCPVATVYVQSAANVDLKLMSPGLSWTGPACPPYPPLCRGNDQTTFCTHLDINGAAEGACDLTLYFSDRPVQVIHARFGPRITQGCCAGFAVIGDSVFTIPTSADAGILGNDGPTDAVGPPPPDGGTDAPADATDAD